MIVKICKIHGPLVSDQIRKDKRCKLCRSITNKRTYYKDPKRVEYATEWKRKNRLHVNEWAKEDRKNNPEKHKEWSKSARKRLGQHRNVIEISRRRGISTDQYYEMLEKQKYLCAICKEPEKRMANNGNKLSQLSLDHNHITGKVREFLCVKCNMMIGNFCEDINIMECAIEYLINHGELCKK